MANAIAAEAAAAAAQPTWDIRLNEVECTEVALSLMLRPLHGSFSMKWIKKFGGGTPDVLLVFDGQKPAETALTMLGTGACGGLTPIVDGGGDADAGMDFNLTVVSYLHFWMMLMFMLM